MNNVSTIFKKLHNETRDIDDKYIKVKETIFTLKYKVLINNKICFNCNN